MKFSKKSLRFFGPVTFLFLFSLTFPHPISATPGDTLRRIIVPQPSPTCCGIGIAVDCFGVLYYTNTFIDTLYSMDAFGSLLGQVPLTDSATGLPISLGALSWDDSRMVLWAGTDNSGCPVKVYTIDPSTGIATLKFSAIDLTF